MGGYNISYQMAIIIILISGGISNWLSLMYRGESGELRIFVKEIDELSGSALLHARKSSDDGCPETTAVVA